MHFKAPTTLFKTIEHCRLRESLRVGKSPYLGLASTSFALSLSSQMTPLFDNNCVAYTCNSIIVEMICHSTVDDWERFEFRMC